MRKVFLICLLLSIPCYAKTIIVDQNGFGDFNNIQTAITYSYNGDTIKVNPGTYEENVYFDGAAVTLTSMDPNNPAIVQSTIISASSGYSVYLDFFEDSNSVLTGFTITGRGIYCNKSSPIITKNIIRDCSTPGIYSSDRTITKPTISNNEIMNNVGGISRCNGIIDNNIIKKNISSQCGGLYYCNGTIRNNIISGNATTTTYTGGGLFYCDGTIINNVIVGNNTKVTSGNGAGGLYDCDGIIQNNIICLNREKGISLCSNPQNSYNNIWNNTPSNGGTPGVGDLRRDPLFVVDGYWDANGTPETETDDFWVDGDYHLISEAGRWNGAGWVLDMWTSSCIDAGDPYSPIGVEPNPNGGRINMGVYGGTSETSKSISGIIEPVCTNPPSMDTNDDCKIDFTDFAEFASQWMSCGYDIQEACWE